MIRILQVVTSQTLYLYYLNNFGKKHIMNTAMILFQHCTIVSFSKLSKLSKSFESYNELYSMCCKLLWFY